MTDRSVPRHCPSCKKETPQTLSASDGPHKSVSLTCNVCNTVSKTLTFDEIIAELARKFPTSEPPFEVTPIDTTRMRVFVQHHLGEAELPQDIIREHIRITGTAPEVGKKIMALPKGLGHKAFAIPVSEVVRITYKE